MSYVRSDYLIDAQELAERVSEESLRVFDATVSLVPAEKGYRAESGLAVYEEGHIPGAAFFDQIRAVSDTSTGLGFSLPGVDALQAGLRAAGISNDQQVVFYSTSHMMWATRAWWLLHYAGHEQVAVLDGGLAAWQTAGGELQPGVNQFSEGTFTINAREERFVGQSEVFSAITDSSVCTVNALPAGVYTGTAEMSYGRKGHITGSVNVPYDEMLIDGRFRSAEEIKSALSARGLLDAGRVIAYCGGGISATIDAFACLLVGKNEIAVYDGSMSEWVRDESLPMTLGEQPG